MKIFIMRGYHLAGLSVAAKLVYTIFLLFVMLGLWSSVEIYETRVGWQTAAADGRDSVLARYGPPATAAQPLSGGPTLDLPPDEGVAAPADGGGDELAAARWSWLLDVFHQHLFSICVVWLVLAHLFMLTRLHPAITGTVVILSGVVSLLHVLAPLIIFKAGGLTWLMPLSGVGMAITWLLMTGWTGMAMWFGFGRPAEPSAGGLGAR